jgi:hypothetical protein
MGSIREDFALLLDTVDALTADHACRVLADEGIPTYRHTPDFDVAELGAAAHNMLRGVSVLVPQAALERARKIVDDELGETGD